MTSSKKFQLGYSPEQKDINNQYALEKVTKRNFRKNQEFIFPENTPTGVDRFRERVIFPFIVFREEF